MDIMKYNDIKDIGMIDDILRSIATIATGATSFGIASTGSNIEKVWFFGPKHANRVEKVQEKYVSKIQTILDDYQIDLQELALQIAEQALKGK